MSRRAVGAALCAAAAFVLVLAVAMPWWRVIDHDDETGARATFSLVNGEQCVGDSEVTCKSISLDGRPGARDDLFAWAARATLLLALTGAGLGVVLALLGDRRRQVLRAAVAAAAAAIAASAAATVSVERLPASYGTPELASGLWLALVGSALLAAGAAWPLGPPATPSPGRRYGLAAAVAALAIAAWWTLASRAWWHGDAEFGERARSPLGFKVCDLGTCARFGNGAAQLRSLFLLGLVAATAGALLVISAGLVTRVARGRAARSWAIATLAAAGAAVVTAIAALALVPSRGTHLGFGAWAFLAAGLGLGAAAALAMRWIPGTESDDLEPAIGAFTRNGPRPVLAPLGGQAVAPPPRAPTAPPHPPAIVAYAPALSPPPGPRPAPAPPMAPRPSPYCPTCRGATMWHGKRGAWWCSTCKHTL